MLTLRSILQLLCCVLISVTVNQTFAQSKKDTDITIINPSGDTLVIAKKYYQVILKHYPELIHHGMPKNPDQLYISRNNALIFFDSEAGKDLYYEVYAFFLRLSQTDKSVIRKKIDSIFYHIHTIYSQLKCTGRQYYAHRENRIPAYVEYSVYKRSFFTKKPENTDSLKQAFIAQLHILVNTELEIDDDTAGCEPERKQTLPALISKLEMLITDEFYLHEAISFLEATKKGE